MLDLITAGCVRNTCTLVNPLWKQQDSFKFIRTWLPQAWGYVHTISCLVWYEQQLDRLEVVHAHRTNHRTSCRAGWPRGFGELNPRPHSSMFTMSQWIPVLTPTYSPLWYKYKFKLHQCVAQNLSDMWLSTLEIGAAQLRPDTEIVPKSPFLCLNRSPISGMVFVHAQELFRSV